VATCICFNMASRRHVVETSKHHVGKEWNVGKCMDL
jgi:hypothetical protein